MSIIMPYCRYICGIEFVVQNFQTFLQMKIGGAFSLTLQKAWIVAPSLGIQPELNKLRYFIFIFSSFFQVANFLWGHWAVSTHFCIFFYLNILYFSISRSDNYFKFIYSARIFLNQFFYTLIYKSTLKHIINNEKRCKSFQRIFAPFRNNLSYLYVGRLGFPKICIYLELAML